MCFIICRGYEQMEVTCNPNVRDRNNLWNVEDNSFPRCTFVHLMFYLEGLSFGALDHGQSDFQSPVLQNIVVPLCQIVLFTPGFCCK